MASLMGIRILCKAGCKIIFNETKCVVKYNGNIILIGVRDPTTDLWTLPITPAVINEAGTNKTSQQLLASPIVASTPAHPLVGKDLIINKNTPPHQLGSICPLHPHLSQCCAVCSPIIKQPDDINPDESVEEGFLQRAPKHQ